VSKNARDTCILGGGTEAECARTRAAGQGVAHPTYERFQAISSRVLSWLEVGAAQGVVLEAPAGPLLEAPVDLDTTVTLQMGRVVAEILQREELLVLPLTPLGIAVLSG
jgi:hypothetical protein